MAGKAPRVNIGIDASCWWNQRGFGRFTRELLTAMFGLHTDNRYILFVDQHPVDAMQGDNIEVVQVFPKRPLTDAAVAKSSRSPGDMIKLYRAVSAQQLDVMVFPAVYSWFPVPRRLPTVVTLHDAIAEHFPKMIFPDWKSRMLWSLKVKLALSSCQRVVTVSQAAKLEITEYLGYDASLIDVISEAPDRIFRQLDDLTPVDEVCHRYKLPSDQRLIVYVGGFAPHKNLLGFLEGFSAAIASGKASDLALVLVGDIEGAGFHSNTAELKYRIDNDEHLARAVYFTGFVNDEDLVSLYNAAYAVTMPSFSEGFGLPAVEAMACGTPVLASDQGALPEVVSNGGIYFSPYEPDTIATAILEMVTNPKLYDDLCIKAKHQAARFSWEAAAKMMLNYLGKL